jgi:hypothetical protein
MARFSVGPRRLLAAAWLVGLVMGAVVVVGAQALATKRECYVFGLPTDARPILIAYATGFRWDPPVTALTVAGRTLQRGDVMCGHYPAPVIGTWLP